MYYQLPDNTLRFIDPSAVDFLPEGSIALTDEEALALQPIYQPTPLDQIRELEAPYADAQAKMTRQAVLAVALDRACAAPEAANLTREQVHAFLMSQNESGYAVMYTLEQQVAELRKLL